MKALKYFRLINFRRRFCLVFGIIGFAVCLFADSSMGVSLAFILILLSFVDERELVKE